jgi:acetyl-CoA synthetase
MQSVNLVTPVVRRWLDDAAREPEAFWARAAEQLPWFRRWDRVFEWTAPSVGRDAQRPASPALPPQALPPSQRAGTLGAPAFRWFIGGRTNLAYNALDAQVARGRGDHAALIVLNERGERQTLTYAGLLADVTRVAASLRSLGIGTGDRVTVYMPTCREAIVLMLAIVRIGAIHSVVFAGFGARALAERIRASGSIAVVTATTTFRKGKRVPLAGIVDDALALGGHQVRHLVTLERDPSPSRPAGGVERLSWNAFVAGGAGHPGDHVEMEANEPAFILATSGTTATPKLAVHTHGGYQVHIASMGRWCFGLQEGDVWWATSDIGWIVGHSYMVYAPLLAGCTTVVFEGALDHPAPDAHWRTVVEEFGATGIFTSPTAVRMLMRYGEQMLTDVNHARLERIVCAGEVLNPHAWDWLQNHVLGGHVPVIDHMWQTETGGPAFGNPYGLGMLPIKPGSSGPPLPGIQAAVVMPDGSPCAPNEKGIMVITRPFPGMTPTLWGDPERYARDYWEKIPPSPSGLRRDESGTWGPPSGGPSSGSPVYYSGDSAHVDEDGYFWFAGRADEIIKIAAHRLGTIEVESAFLTHPAVAECGVVGRPDETRGEVIAAFVLLKHGQTETPDLRQALLETIRRELGPVAVIGDIRFVAMLPKTRSGKIMRRVLKAVVLDRDPGDITTIEDEGSVEEARAAWEQLRQ